MNKHMSKIIFACSLFIITFLILVLMITVTQNIHSEEEDKKKEKINERKIYFNDRYIYRGYDPIEGIKLYYDKEENRNVKVNSHGEVINNQFDN